MSLTRTSLMEVMLLEPTTIKGHSFFQHFKKFSGRYMPLLLQAIYTHQC